MKMKHNAIKSGFFDRMENYAKGAAGLKEAFKNRPQDIKRYRDDYLKAIKAPGINQYKRVELYKNYRPVVPQNEWEDELYQCPPESILEAVRQERKKRAAFRKGMKADKAKVNELEKQKKLKMELDGVAKAI